MQTLIEYRNIHFQPKMISFGLYLGALIFIAYFFHFELLQFILSIKYVIRIILLIQN